MYSITFIMVNDPQSLVAHALRQIGPDVEMKSAIPIFIFLLVAIMWADMCLGFSGKHDPSIERENSPDSKALFICGQLNVVNFSIHCAIEGQILVIGN